MQLRNHIKNVVEEVASAFENEFQAEIQFDVDVEEVRTLDNKTKDICCNSRGVKITVLIGRNNG